MNIRPYQESDAESVIALWNEVFPNNPSHSSPKLIISQKLAVQPELFFITEISFVILSTIIAGYDGHRGWLYTVAVSPNYQRQGIGSKLMRHAERILIAMGCLKINLQVRVSNAEVVEFYRKLGYLVEERVSMGKLIA